MHNTPQPLNSISGKSLVSQPIEPLGFTVADILPHGLFILAGSAKTGKSWLALDLCHAVATGGKLWNRSTTQGDVLYLALEDTPRRMRERLATIAPGYGTGAPGDIHFVHRSQKLGQGLAEQLDVFLAKHAQTQLIVVDTLQYIRDTGGPVGTYASDYHDMDALRAILKGRKLTMLLVTHNHKTDDKDPLNRVYGSTGLTGAVDGIFVLEKKRSSSDAKLTIANRDTESHVFELRFNRQDCRWQFMGLADDEVDNDAKLHDLLNLLLDNNPTWSGTATSLQKALSELDPAFYLPPATLSKALKGDLEYLQSEYKIECNFSRNRSKRTIELSRREEDAA